MFAQQIGIASDKIRSSNPSHIFIQAFLPRKKEIEYLISDLCRILFCVYFLVNLIQDFSSHSHYSNTLTMYYLLRYNDKSVGEQ